MLGSREGPVSQQAQEKENDGNEQRLLLHLLLYSISRGEGPLLIFYANAIISTKIAGIPFIKIRTILLCFVMPA
jgi:hypothetical protein